MLPTTTTAPAHPAGAWPVRRKPPSNKRMVWVEPQMARLLARLEQLRNEGAEVVVDLKTMTLRVCGKEEIFADRQDTAPGAAPAAAHLA